MTLPDELSNPTIYSGLKAQSDFHVHSNHISNSLLSASGIATKAALAMNESLDSWSKTIPAYFSLTLPPQVEEHWYLFARSRLWWRYWNLKIILFRQLLLGRAVERRSNASDLASDPLDQEAIKIAVDAAQSTIVSINDYLGTANLTRLASWYSV